MGRVLRRAANRALQRQQSIDAMRNADSSQITRLGRGRQGWTSNQRYQQGIEDGMTGAMTGNQRDPLYMEGHAKGKRIRFQQLHPSERDRRIDALMAQRRAAQPTADQITAELAARTAADERRKAQRRASGLFDALR